MNASNQRQFNIRSSLAYDLAHGYAEKHGKTLREVVEAALSMYTGRRTIPSTKVTPEEADANYKAIMEGIREANRLYPVKFSSQDIDAEFYDEFGLPK